MLCTRKASAPDFSVLDFCRDLFNLNLNIVIHTIDKFYFLMF